MPPHQLKPPPSPPVSKERNTCIHRRTLSRIKPVSKTIHKKLGDDDDEERHLLPTSILARVETSTTNNDVLDGFFFLGHCLMGEGTDVHVLLTT